MTFAPLPPRISIVSQNRVLTDVIHSTIQLHGATYVVDCEFITEQLVPGSNWVVDIGEASTVLKQVLAEYNYKNLDDFEKFKGQNTTTEFMCKQIFDGVAAMFKTKFQGEIRIKLAESHAAWATYTGRI